jgi:hypothetical protein
MTASILSYNQAVGGSGGVGANGGNGWGGGLFEGGNPNGDVTATVVDSTLAYNQALGGSGGFGANGGNGLGGGLYTVATAQATLVGSLIVNNQAVGGAAGFSGADGRGIGGGVYIVTGSMVSADSDTLITGNHASTSDDDVSGDLGSGPSAHQPNLRREAVTGLFANPGVLEAIVGDPAGW